MPGHMLVTAICSAYGEAAVKNYHLKKKNIINQNSKGSKIKKTKKTNGNILIKK